MITAHNTSTYDEVPSHWFSDLVEGTVLYLYHIHRAKDSGNYDKGYIGLTNNPCYRYKQHTQYPHNPIIERNFKKHKDTTMTILLRGDVETVSALEEFFRPEARMGWNFNSGGLDSKNRSNKGLKFTPEQIEHMHKHNLKDYTLWKDGVEYKFRLMTLFAKEHNLDVTCVRAVLLGENKHHKGFTLKNEPIDNRKLGGRIPDIEFECYDPDGNHLSTTIYELADKLNVAPSKIKDLYDGTYRSVKGYYITPHKVRKKYSFKSITLRSPQGKHITHSSHLDFKQYGITPSDISKLIKGQKKVRYWTLVSYEV